MGTEQRGVPTSTADELENIGPRIAKALIASHGNDRRYLERVRDGGLGQRGLVEFVEKCPYCLDHLDKQCPACAVKVQILLAIEKHLETLPRAEERFDLASRIAP